jgi:hypothetical protein
MLGFFLQAASTSSTGDGPNPCFRSCDAGSSIDGGDDAYDPCFLFLKQSHVSDGVFNFSTPARKLRIIIAHENCKI